MAYSNHDVAHNFAHQTGEKMNATSMFYEINDKTSTIYSYGYHFGLATILKDTNTLIITSEYYSYTTQKHKNIVDQATSHFTKKIRVPIDTTFVLRDGTVTKHDKKRVIQRFRDEINTYVEAQAKARTKDYSNELRFLIRDLTTFCTYFKCKNLLSGHLRKIIVGKQDYQSVFFSPEQIAIYKRNEKLRKQRDADYLKKAVKDFRNFDVRNLNTKYTYLRYNEKRNVVETSKGMNLEDLDALRSLYKLMKKGVELENVTKIQGFNVNKVTPDYVKAGCHTITRKEADKLAKQLNF
jgi:hypothetical protein